MRPPRWIARILVLSAFALTISGGVGCGSRSYAVPPPPFPLLSAQNPVDWWFAFKFNTVNFPGCKAGAVRACQFGGQPQKYYSGFGQQFVYASSENEALQEGIDCLGDTLTDPVGATFDEMYNGDFNFVVWNDQFYNDPLIAGCNTYCDTPWGHSKGMLAWDNSGDGLVLQVTTPSWPAAGNKAFPRLTDGNTLGCVKDDNVLVSQQFFALRLTKADVLIVLQALANSSVVTDPANPQIVRNGGPADIQQLVSALGNLSTSHTAIVATLSSGVRLISKPSNLEVPPWQMVSALLGGHALAQPPGGKIPEHFLPPPPPPPSAAGTHRSHRRVLLQSPPPARGQAKPSALRVDWAPILTTPSSASPSPAPTPFLPT